VKKRRVLVLVHPTLIPPASLRGRSAREIEEWRVEFDVVAALRGLRHDVRILGVLDSLIELDATLRDWRPHVVFNLLEEFNGIVSYESHVVAHLELMQQPYTGCNPRGLMLARDKLLCKQLLVAAGIRTPAFHAVAPGSVLRLPAVLKFPLIVKSARDDASLGIAQGSVVRNLAQCHARVRFMHRQFGAVALIEEYIPGRELYVAMLGDMRPRTFPVWELQFGRLPASMSRIATRHIKWDRAYQHRLGIGPRRAMDLPRKALTHVTSTARQAYRALQLSGYARIDFRMREDGELFVLEANPNPNLARIEDFATSAAAAGIHYEKLIGQIVATGLAHRAEWRS
jgi:D-alanine-D-alanine ligase